MIPREVLNWIGGAEIKSDGDTFLDKCNPTTGQVLCRVARSGQSDVERAVRQARASQPAWAERTTVSRGDLLREAALLMRARLREVAEIVAAETGKSVKDAVAETGAAIEMGIFVAGEGRRFYGHTTTSAVPNRAAMTIRQPLGVAGLIVPANTPIANVAWKAFPALLCGNSVILKAAEDAPYTALAFAKMLHEVGVPAGVLNVIQGLGEEAGAALVEHSDVDIISFTGSCKVGRYIARTAGERLAKVCLELGGKNPLIVCDDADLERAADAAALSAFSNAGQRCAAGSRIIVFAAIYEEFRDLLVKRTGALRVGFGDDFDLGPVINERQLNNMLAAVRRAVENGSTLLTGGHRLSGPGFDGGYFMAPTLIEEAGPGDEISRQELFGPISCLYRVRDFQDALELANRSPFGLTAAIHTRSADRAMVFMSRIQSGVASINGPTYGSEPHMPFGGLKQSGNGTREAGMEALDVYSEWKTVYFNFSPGSV